MTDFSQIAKETHSSQSSTIDPAAAVISLAINRKIDELIYLARLKGVRVLDSIEVGHIAFSKHMSVYLKAMVNIIVIQAGEEEPTDLKTWLAHEDNMVVIEGFILRYLALQFILEKVSDADKISCFDKLSLIVAHNEVARYLENLGSYKEYISYLMKTRLRGEEDKDISTKLTEDPEVQYKVNLTVAGIRQQVLLSLREKGVECE